MLPVTHGVETTKAYVLNYAILLVIVTLLPFLTGMSGFLYVIAALLLGSGFIYYAVKLKNSDDSRVAMQTFHYSISYLVALFSFLLLDHYIPQVWPG
jgi:protoheme IX farnesyltransferase